MNPTITHNLTPAQAAGLRAKCAEYGVSPEELLARFIADLTDTAGKGGSDESRMAGEWAARSLWFGTAPKSEKAIQRMWRFQEAAYRAQKTEEDAYRAKSQLCLAYVQKHGGAR